MPHGKPALRGFWCYECGDIFYKRLSNNHIKNRNCGRFCSQICSSKFTGANKVFSPPIPRFWPKVQKTKSCWLWSGATGRGDYGHFIVKRKLIKAHRFSWELVNGKIPSGLHCLHHCDNPPCVRPDHLFLGTDLDNARDAINKGRPWGRPKGSKDLKPRKEREVRNAET